ncbi:beta-propeller fold lactonase family protein [bacterium]|nr:beta-propeller fold lactonase family protein [bacterium]
MIFRQRSLPVLLSLIFVSPAFAQEPAPDAAKQAPTWPGLKRDGRVLLPNGWSLQPAGKQLKIGDLPVQMVQHPTEPVIAILHAGYGEHEVITVQQKTGRMIGRASVPHAFSGIVFSPDGKTLYVGGGFDDTVQIFDYADGFLFNRRQMIYPDRAEFLAAPAAGFGGVRKLQRAVGGLAISGDGKTLWTSHVFAHTVGRFDLTTGEYAGELKLPAESYPYQLTFDQARNRLYVSLWGAAKVAVVDTAKFEMTGTFETQEHPNEMALNKSGQVLFVANANRNTVSVIETETGKNLETIGTAIAPNLPPGSTPNSLALTPDESLLFVTNANTNDVAVINVSKPGKSQSLGFIPVGWYPTSVRVGPDGKTLFVTNAKGNTSRPNREGPNPLVAADSYEGKLRDYIGGLFQGTLSTIPVPTPGQLATMTKTVLSCSPVNTGDPTTPRGAPAARAENNPIPAKQGETSPITHCVYIIKENRTYDQVFGDIAKGNGDPDLCLFPEKVTPNQHAIVEEFVLLDNFYVESEVSADGHEWTMGAYATDFVERLWPIGYRGDRRAPYPAEGKFELATPAGGYLWDRAAAKNVTYRSYGEFTDNGPTPADPSTTKVKALQGHFDPKYRSYDLTYPDAKRAARFLEELAEFEAKGEMPRLIVMRLPNDHTSGTRPGSLTPTAMVAENDLAVGMVVEGLSKSKFWKNLAIFVIEDDAQNGSDHVDAHRTTAMVVSPWTKRKHVDSTMYTTSSMLRTMELILGLDPMSQFDAAARPMYNAFTAQPNFEPFTKIEPKVDIRARNTATAWGAEKSMKLDLDKEDQADDLVFNEIIWKSVKGADSPMPAPVRAAFIFPIEDEDEDEDDDEDDDDDDDEKDVK